MAYLNLPFMIIPIHHHQLNLVNNFNKKFGTISTPLINTLTFSNFCKNFNKVTLVYRKNLKLNFKNILRLMVQKISNIILDILN